LGLLLLVGNNISLNDFGALGVTAPKERVLRHPWIVTLIIGGCELTKNH